MASLRDAGARADALAIAYGEQWRSVLVARSLSFVFANAISGLVGALFPKLAIATIPIQFLATALIFVDRRMATRGRWRTKWLEYRTLAERLRVERFLALSGAAFPRAGASPWIEWLTRRLALPLPRAPDAAAVLRRLVDVEMADQIEYHQGAFQRFGALDRRIRGAATSSLVGLMTLGAAIAVLGFTPYAMAASSPWPAVGLALSVAPTIQATLNYVRRDLDVAGQLERSARNLWGVAEARRGDRPRAARRCNCARGGASRGRYHDR